MYNYLKGKVDQIGNGFVVIECGGIGYEVAVLDTAILAIKSGEEAKIYTYFSASESGIGLYGFIKKEEKAMFLRLISISGIGPKAAMTVLSGVTVGGLASIILSGDVVALTKIKGVGKKTAERIILELKDKISGEYAAQDLPKQSEGGLILSDAAKDAVLALMSMGYTKNESANLIKSVAKPDLSIEELVILALRQTDR